MTASRAQPVQRGWGGGGKLAEAAGRPAYSVVCLPDDGTAAKEEHRFLPRTGAGADSRRRSLVRHTPRCRTAGAPDIMLIIRIKPLIDAQAVTLAHRRRAYNSPTLC
ncbi:hypothetical protein [Xenorhabdus vietnamensis]|uniref:hypothetical protein n=1 Tax=Xenorhabdus vietnamensis TaxID=351656 RepID=UPI00142E13C3|nr:hypothetical protein [Xenorhabdus vietnamensis]